MTSLLTSALSIYPKLLTNQGTNDQYYMIPDYVSSQEKFLQIPATTQNKGLISFYVASYTHKTKGGTNRQVIYKNRVPHFDSLECKFFLEPNNPFDSNAIQIGARISLKTGLGPFNESILFRDSSYSYLDIGYVPRCFNSYIDLSLITNVSLVKIHSVQSMTSYILCPEILIEYKMPIKKTNYFARFAFEDN